ncbi:MAG: TlpA family protein disulfide reductase [Acidimicrobiales bacterium]
MPADRIIALLALTAVAVAVALVLQRRRADPPSAPSYRAPTQLDRDDFDQPPSPRLVVLFASDSCQTCPGAWAAVVEACGPDGPRAGVPHTRVSVEGSPELHQRYRVDAVPTTVIADADGVVVQALFGPVGVDDVVHAIDTPG